MKANRIPKIDVTRTSSSDARAYGGPAVAGIEFEDGYDSLQILPDSPNATVGRRLAVAGVLPIGTLGVAATQDIDFRKAQHVTATFGAGNITFTFTGGQPGWTYTLALKQDSVGSRTVTWPAAVRWTAATAPTLTTTANKIDIVRFIFDGTNYNGSTVALNYT